jgi:hypothetical protein
MQTVIIGISKLRRMNGRDLRELREILHIQDFSNSNPIAVVIPYDEYLSMQSVIIKTFESVQSILEKEPNGST